LFGHILHDIDLPDANWELGHSSTLFYLSSCVLGVLHAALILFLTICFSVSQICLLQWTHHPALVPCLLLLKVIDVRSSLIHLSMLFPSHSNDANATGGALQISDDVAKRCG